MAFELSPMAMVLGLIAASTAVAIIVTNLVRKAPPLEVERRKDVGSPVKGHLRLPSAAEVYYPNGILDIYFGSQTGTAEGFAKALTKLAGKYGFEGRVIDLEAFEPAQLQAASLAVFLLATYGEGDPTDNAMTFARWLKNEDGELSEQALGGLKYAVFGLGSTQYEHYNKMGKTAFKKLGELGAEAVVELGLGDELTVEEDFEKWTEGLWPALSEAAARAGRANSISITEPLSSPDTDLEFSILYIPGDRAVPSVKKYEDSQIQSSTKYYFHALDCPIVVNRELRQPADGGSTRHIEIDISKANIQYNTADNLAVLPENDAETVASVVRALDYKPDQVFELIAPKVKFPSPCTIRAALTSYVDLSGIPRRTVLGQLAKFAQNPEEGDRLRFLASKQGRGEYNQFIVREGRSLAELVIDSFPSLVIPFPQLINLAPNLQPRYYTISSSNSVYPGSIHLTVAVTKDELGGRKIHWGVCSSHLAKPVTQRLKVFVRPSSFRLPADVRKPIVMVGPGTGIAPMRALLQERRQHRLREGSDEVGETILYFGCRRRDVDFLYEEELMGYVRDGTLSDLQLAFSREQSEKIYVQHLLMQAKNARRLWELVAEKSAHIYVCGGTSMGLDVHKAFVSLIQKEGARSADEALALMQELQGSGRYVAELWSA